MKQVNVTANQPPLLLIPTGTMPSIYVWNNSSTDTLYLCYDGSDYTQLSSSTGMPILPKTGRTVSAPGGGCSDVYAVAGGSTSIDVRIQGDS